MHDRTEVREVGGEVSVARARLAEGVDEGGSTPRVVI